MRLVRLHPRLAAFVDRHADPATATGFALVVGALFVVVAVAGVGVLFAMVRSRIGLERSDEPIAEWAAANATDTGATLLRWVSLLGGTSGVVLVASVVALTEARRKRHRGAIELLVLTIAGQFALSNIIKLLVARARPDIDQLTGHSGASFPSGHATAAAATFAVAALLLGRGRSHRTASVLWGIAAAVAVAVGATRVMLGVHWTTDVLAGLLLGWGWFALCSIAFGGRFLRFGEPAAVAHRVTVHEEALHAAEAHDARRGRGSTGDGALRDH